MIYIKDIDGYMFKMKLFFNYFTNSCSSMRNYIKVKMLQLKIDIKINYINDNIK